MNPLNHVAIIMDGNGRWGLRYKNSRNAGHKAGLKTVEKIIKEIDSSLIREVTTFDVYQGDKIPKDKKSVAINVSLQALDKTLSEGDLDQISKKIIDIVKNKTGATIRS